MNTKTISTRLNELEESILYQYFNDNNCESIKDYLNNTIIHARLHNAIICINAMKKNVR